MRGRYQDGGGLGDSQGKGRHSQQMLNNDPFLKSLYSINESKQQQSNDI